MSVFILGSYAKALVMTTDRIPLAGETLIGYDFRQTWGGKGSDMAVQAVRLGQRSPMRVSSVMTPLAMNLSA